MICTTHNVLKLWNGLPPSTTMSGTLGQTLGRGKTANGRARN
ncbi:MAG: hypothetical protein OJF52_001384 [Nitrospira sp.]|nr:MAG: hypothetical protein OJF52_001384 [Nitrospira sp.]